MRRQSKTKRWEPPFLLTKKRSDAPAAGARAPKQAPLKKRAEEAEIDPSVFSNPHILVRPHGAIFEPLAVGVVICEDVIPEINKSFTGVGIKDILKSHRCPRETRQGHLLWRIRFYCTSCAGIIHPGTQKLTSSFMGRSLFKILPEGTGTGQEAVMHVGLRRRGRNPRGRHLITPIQSVQGIYGLRGLGARSQAKVAIPDRGSTPPAVGAPGLRKGRERGNGEELAAVVAPLPTQARRGRARGGRR